ncbi:MAG TPA: UMP kinase, partial [Lentimicrobium sp.]|nr:UMP kinase [Lentimicrobium sp.]
IAFDPIAESMSRRKAIDYLKEGKVVIIAAGTGNPFFTTDTASALRAIEIQADVIMKGTRVDGIYTADPEKVKDAVKYETISYTDVYEKGLNIMDLTAFTLCMENQLPILVFNMNTPGNLLKVINGENIGTVVSN